MQHIGVVSCNINLQLTKKVPVMFHNVKGYGSHLIFYERKKSDGKINLVPNGLEKYMSFILNKTSSLVTVCNL